MGRAWRTCALLVLVLAALPALAAPRAWLQPDRVALGETTTLNIEADASPSAPPDFSALRGDFELQGQSSSTQMSSVNGRASVHLLFAVVLEPKRAGTLTIPAIRVGNESTQPVTLTVTPGRTGSAEQGDALFLEGELGTSEPYVQQAVPYTLRLYFALPLTSGDIDARLPDNAGVQKLADDRQYQTERNGQRYNVLERRLLLIPERSGALELPAPIFRGRARSNDLNAFFDGGVAVSTQGKAQTLHVRAQPADAPDPWLAANALQLSRAEPKAGARTGEPTVLELSLRADGATPAQLPELNLPAVADAQVFPERPQSRSELVDGRPQAILTRRFAIVPSRTGTLHVPPVRVPYWNTRENKADVAELAPFDLAVAAGAVPAAVADGATGATIGDANKARLDAQPQDSSDVPVAATTGIAADVRAWRALALTLAAALAGALWWGWRRGIAPTPRTAVARGADNAGGSPATLQRALAQGDLAEIAASLRAFAGPGVSLDALRGQLDDESQRAALALLQHASWGSGSDTLAREEALAALRSAFRDGVRLRSATAASANDPLPPLYPAR